MIAFNAVPVSKEKEKRVDQKMERRITREGR
jgi:hypothetical protein